MSVKEILAPQLSEQVNNLPVKRRSKGEKTRERILIAAIEVLLNSPYVAELIKKGEIGGIKEVMEKSKELGMQTFDQALFNLYQQGLITYADALHHADSPNDLRLMIKLRSNDQGGVGALSGITVEGLEPKEDDIL